MKRIQLFEFEDFPWFPGWLRQLMTLYLAAFHRALGTADLLAPLLARALESTGTDRIVDLCSGGGGPLPDVLRKLQDGQGVSPRVTLTDLYPNRTAAARINSGKDPALSYRETPVDASNVPADLTGMRTMVSCFHHMPPEVAKKILADAFHRRQPICIFELSDNRLPTWTWWFPFPIAFLSVLLITPLVRPMSFSQIFFTYVIPILPLVITWDGLASNARTYGVDDLRELTRDLTDPGYTWEIGELRKPRFPSAFPYLLGLPLNA